MGLCFGGMQSAASCATVVGTAIQMAMVISAKYLKVYFIQRLKAIFCGNRLHEVNKKTGWSRILKKPGMRKPLLAVFSCKNNKYC